MKFGPWEFKRFEVEKPTRATRSTIGAAGTSRYESQGEYNTSLNGQQAISAYEIMRRSDATCAAILYAIKAPLLGAQWFVEPASEDPIDQEAAKFVEYALLQENIYTDRSFLEILQEMLNAFDYGHYAFEKVWSFGEYISPITKQSMPAVYLADLAPRHPRTISEFLYDEHGYFTGIIQEAVSTEGNYREVTIPADKLLLFTFREESGDKRGISVLRQAYKSWYFQEHLYKIDAIQKERHALGIPTFKLPLGYTDEDKQAADEMGRNMRTNERTHITLPPEWDFELKTPDGDLIDVLASIGHHNTSIAKTVLAQFLSMGTEGAGGSRALGDVTTKLFYRAWLFAGGMVCAAFNKQVIPELVKYNFDVREMPRLRVRKVGEESDWRALAVALQALVNANIMIPDERVEEWIRTEIGVPGIDTSTLRPKEPTTPPGPGNKDQSSSREEKEDEGEAEERKGDREVTKEDV